MPQFESSERNDLSSLKNTIPSTPILYTDRMMLVPYTAQYLSIMTEWFGNWDIIQNFSTKIKAAEAEKNALQKLYDTANGDSKFILLPRTPEIARELGTNPVEPLGFIDYHKIPVDGVSHRMYAMDPKFERRGLMNEAINRTHHYIFVNLGWEKLLVCNAVNNGRSNNLKIRGGIFIETGIIKKEYNNGEKFARTFRLMRDDYMASDAFAKQHADVITGKYAPRPLLNRRLSSILAILPVAAAQQQQVAPQRDMPMPLASPPEPQSIFIPPAPPRVFSYRRKVSLRHS